MADVFEESIVRLQAIYDKMSGPSGRIDARGLKSVLDMIGANYSDSDVMDLVVEMNPREKALDFVDFLAIMTRPLGDDVGKDLEDAFTVLDRQKRGAVDAEDLRHVLSAVISTDISSLTAREMIAECCEAGEEDSGRDKLLRREDFLKVMQK